MKEDKYRWQRWLGYYSFSNLDSKTLPIAAMYSMQHGRALELLIWEVVTDEPALWPAHVHKVDASDGFYSIVLCLTDTANMGPFFPL